MQAHACVGWVGGCVPVRIIGVCVILLYSHCWHIFSGKCIRCVWNKHTRLANCAISYNATFDAPFILHHGNYIQITSQNRNLQSEWAEKGREKECESKECVREWGVQSEVTSVSSYNHLLYFTLNSQPLTFYIQCMVYLFITIYRTAGNIGDPYPHGVAFTFSAKPSLALAQCFD